MTYTKPPPQVWAGPCTRVPATACPEEGCPRSGLVPAAQGFTCFRWNPAFQTWRFHIKTCISGFSEKSEICLLSFPCPPETSTRPLGHPQPPALPPAWQTWGAPSPRTPNGALSSQPLLAAQPFGGPPGQVVFQFLVQPPCPSRCDTCRTLPWSTAPCPPQRREQTLGISVTCSPVRATGWRVSPRSSVGRGQPDPCPQPRTPALCAAAAAPSGLAHPLVHVGVLLPAGWVEPA